MQHQLGETLHQARRQTAFGVLNPVEIFDQQRPLIRRIADDRARPLDLQRIEHAAFGMGQRLAAASSGMNPRPLLLAVV